MRFNELKLVEFSPLTLSGSFSKGLVLNKLWLISELKKIKSNFSTIYVLGSWYANMAILLSKSSIRYDRIVNVEIDKKVAKEGQRIADLLDTSDKIKTMIKDANKLDYKLLDKNGLVINTSCHDMENNGWFDNIPNGTLVALQSRNDVEDDLSKYKFHKILFNGGKLLKDPETEYVSLMKIGIK